MGKNFGLTAEQNSPLHLLHIFHVGENESLLRVEPKRHDVSCVLPSELFHIRDLQILLEQELLVIGQLDHKRNFENVL